MTFINIGGFMKDNIICDNCKKEVEENDDFDGYYCPFCGCHDTSYSYSDYFLDKPDEEFNITHCNECGIDFKVEKI